MHFWWLALKNVRLLHPSLNFWKISIFLASSGSFNVKNDNIHTFFFSLFWLQILNLPALLQNKNTRIGPFTWKRPILQNSDRERTNQSIGICRRLGMPYDKYVYLNSSPIDELGKLVPSKVGGSPAQIPGTAGRFYGNSVSGNQLCKKPATST